MNRVKSSNEQFVQSWVDLNLRYYKALTTATIDYYRSIAHFYAERSPLRPFATPVTAPPSPRERLTETPPLPPTPVPTVVLEAVAGDEAEGGFVVVNRLPRTVSASFVVEPFVDIVGHRAAADLRIEPSSVTLEGGAQTIVRLAVRVTKEMSAGVDYRGWVTVPGISDTPIEIILRRLRDRPAAVIHEKLKKKTKPRKA
jgi:hypothetical protein